MLLDVHGRHRQYQSEWKKPKERKDISKRRVGYTLTTYTDLLGGELGDGMKDGEACVGDLS